ncbi:MAG TPA: DUF2934 domain-containing protein [Terriglobales bacterium]|jgi:hypothetical protein
MTKDKAALSTRSNVEPQNLEEQIRMRAFELYVERGGGDGSELEDWLRAEAEITNASAKAQAA